MDVEHCNRSDIITTHTILLALFTLIPTRILFYWRQQSCILMLPLQITQRKKCTFPRSWHMCLFTETYLYNTSNKTNSTSGNQGVDVTSISFPKFHEGEGKKKSKLPLAVLCLRCTERFKSKSRFPSKCLFIHPVGGATPSGTHVQWKMYCSGSMLSSEQVYFYPFHAQNHKDINVCVRHARKT